MDIALANLPYYIFSDIILYLPPIQVLRCRRISRIIHEALTRDELCITLILKHFPRALEGRRLRQLLEADEAESLDRGDWAVAFARLTRRYHHLGRAEPWKKIKVPVLRDAKLLQGVATWNRLLSLANRNTLFHYQDPVWTVAPTEGLLVYPAPKTDHSKPEYRARDLATGVEVRVPFGLKGKIVRRLRISHGILAIEWCLNTPRKPVGVTGEFHNHYATFYDVRRTGSWDGIIPQRPALDGTTPTYTWKIKFRCEFLIYPFGLPVNSVDRFFSAHNATHYAVYTWQATRFPHPTLNNTAEPIERLTIWEIGAPSKYRPSDNVFGIARQDATVGPRIIRSLAGSQLEAWSVLQGTRPSLRTLALDDCTWDASRSTACGHVFFSEEEHRWSSGGHSSERLPRFHLVKTTGIPLIGEGPRWVDECRGGTEANIQPSRRSRWRIHATETYEEEDSDYEDDGENAAGGNRDGSSSGTTVTNTTAANSFLETRPWARHAETWPGRAPCWRHIEFPYLTMSEVLDIPAGIRIVARNCFMLAVISSFPMDKIYIQGVNKEGPIHRKRRRKRNVKGLSEGSRHSGSSSSSNSPFSHQSDQLADVMQSQGREEVLQTDVPFGVKMWPQIMCRGSIFGDERWLLGETPRGDVLILVF
ncbi:hypothetical protein TRIATDRAFT_316181 [Trichoderma atroviride IMI 206040]|uniref:F-box domain-containing protein n=2 Tax=Hypocrea atroviridis TaxID=63577 RepID=G9NMC0_HYPAI|nr:uncharacterized protein TRIATDRAFT_316181 [Trichoderma atroviride IMI 206040]EHK48051.1 hypothetical protein TRIATDRAFT_316181 [Trichoderma atroviride IMI 206040]